MDTADFDFILPEELIAAWPAARRGDDRLLVLEKGSGALSHRHFSALGDCLVPGDLLVLNDSRVRRARLHARRPSGGRVEVLLLASEDGFCWECLLGGSRRLGPGSVLRFDLDLEAEVLEKLPTTARIRFSRVVDDALLDRLGEIPLPPYITRLRAVDEAIDADRYQTVYAGAPGAVAAPTAGLHFTEELLQGLATRGIRSVRLTLEVGWGTFAPVKSGALADHRMHSERYELPEATVAAIRETRARGRRVVAVGTTVVRTLEAAALGGELVPGRGETDIFIKPGFRFRVVDALLTNFHTPRSTLLVLVSAFAGRERILAAYAEAVKQRYRFFSYGDAMLIVP